MISEREDHKQNGQATQVQRDTNSSRFLFSNEEWASLAYEFKLSFRELQIVQGIFGNQTERQTTLHLGISHHTIHSHLRRV